MSALDDVLKTITARRAATLRRGRVRLEVVSGPDAGLHHVFDERARVGTRAIADLVLHDAKISGLHFELGAQDLRLRDLGSKNGTFVAGVRVVEALLSPRETLTAGDTRIRVLPLQETLEVALSSAEDFHGLVGSSPAMRALIAKLERLAASDATVLILGETGTGKERVAEAIHSAGTAGPRPIVVVDCAALNPNLIESQLLGHEKGAFTGAVASVPGAFERAHGGTVFLDEVGELPLELQPKLLRVLESRTVTRLGGAQPTQVNVRVLAATHKDLALEVAKGRFREDLYYRLAVVTVGVPPLRERQDDVPALAVRLLRDAGAEPEAYLTADSLAALMAHDWPGNVRELRNTLERAVALSRPVEIAEPTSASQVLPEVDLRVPLRQGKRELIDRYERAYVGALLAECGGNVSEAARRAGMDRMSIHRIAGRLQLRKDR